MSQSETVNEALTNLQAIKEGEDPRIEDPQSVDIEIHDQSILYDSHDTSVRDREEIDKEFLRVLNIVEPEHPYYDDPYPLTMRELDLSYCTSKGSFLAKCGPRATWNTGKVSFSADRRAMSKMKRERFYNVLVHEVTHVTEGRHSAGSTHNPTFWKQMANNAVTFIESGEVRLNISKFVSCCRHEPSRSMTDRRMRTVEEQRQEVEDIIVRQL